MKATPITPTNIYDNSQNQSYLNDDAPNDQL